MALEWRSRWLGRTRLDRVNNSVVRERVGTQADIIDTTECKRLRWHKMDIRWCAEFLIKIGPKKY